MFMPFIISLLCLFVHSLDAEEQETKIDRPNYQGVEQILVLSKDYVIVVTENIPKVLKELDRLTDGKYSESSQAFRESVERGNEDWESYKEQRSLLKENLAMARMNAGEQLLNARDYYWVYSQSDKEYTEPKHPSQVSRYLVSLGAAKHKDFHHIHYAHYSYLRLPESMKNGHHYSIKLGDGKTVHFLYDEMRTVSRAIKVNQVGYMPSQKRKYAYLGAYVQELGHIDFSRVKEFHVVDEESGEIVYTGPVQLRSKRHSIVSKRSDPNKARWNTGEDVYEMDLGPLKHEGSVFITVPGVGRSWTFRHSEDIYGEVFYTAARALYHQRCGIEVGEPYTRWPRKKCHTDPVYESETLPFWRNVDAPKDYREFDVIAASIDTTRSTKDATGGWHDAADWDRNIAHYLCVFDLMYLYEMHPNKFTDGQLFIPESGNGIPDILDEAEYGLSVWTKSMNKLGGVSGIVETWTHPSIDDPKVKYAYSQRTRWSSLTYAAAAAQFALLIRPFNEDKYEQYKALAFKAYEFGSKIENSLGKTLLHARENRGRGKTYTIPWEEKEEDLRPFLTHAHLRLFMLTKNTKYLDLAVEDSRNAPRPYEWPFNMRDFSPWLYYSFLLISKEDLHSFVQMNWAKKYEQTARELAKWSIEQPYRQSWPKNRDFWMEWGATFMTNQSRALLLASEASENHEYFNIATLNADFILGANPMGMSWVTGLGSVYPIEIQHDISNSDGIADPVPGIGIYGITGGMYSDLKKLVWTTKTVSGEEIQFMNPANQNIPVWRTWSCHPKVNVPQNEFTIHETISSLIFTSGMLMPEDWMPSEELKNRQPKDEKKLHGYWYMP